ncbi:MAG: branched-chain amino acid ABC transporter permease, partial [Phycisphaerae bacterium]|nr:branched-chain amino acid ABC transporter permease [Phycisphaerae bacterium]
STGYPLFQDWLGLPLLPALALGVALAVVAGCSMELLIYQPLKRRKASAVILLVASLGIYIALQNVVSIVFGDDIKTLGTGLTGESVSIFGALLTSIQLVTVIISFVLLVVLGVTLRSTKIGMVLRAVSNDPELAGVLGAHSDRVTLIAFAIGSGLAGLAGVLVALDVHMTPTMGMNMLMLAIVAVIVGGRGSLPGVTLGALLLAAAQQFGIWKLPSQWQDAIAFFVLVIFLILRPQGVFGQPLKKVTV